MALYETFVLRTCLSAIKGVNQAFARFTPFLHPEIGVSILVII